MEFDRTDSSYIENKIEQANLRLEIGRVVKVFEHTAADDNSNFEVNVILRDENEERRAVPIMTPRKGEIAPPEQGDKVIVGFLDGASAKAIVLGNLYDVATRPPLGRAGMYRLKRGNLYLEAHEDGDWIRISHKDSDDGTPNARIEIDDVGDVRIYGNDRVRIKDSEQTIQLTQSADVAEGGANEFNYNQSTWTVVPWDTEASVVDPSYNSGTNYIEIKEDGTYEVYANIYYQTPSTSNRLSVTMRFTKNGNPLNGYSGNGFVSGQSNHTEASTNHKQIYEFQSGDRIRVETRQEAASGDLHPVANQGLFQIQRLQR